MRRRPRASAGRAPAAIGHVNVTPMIDVVMVLIVFFLLVGNLARREAGFVDLPAAAGGDDRRDDAPIVVGVPSPGVVTLEGREIAQEALGEQLTRVLARAPARGHVELRAARDLDYADVRSVLAEIRESGLHHVTLVAEQR